MKLDRSERICDFSQLPFRSTELVLEMIFFHFHIPLLLKNYKMENFFKIKHVRCDVVEFDKFFNDYHFWIQSNLMLGLVNFFQISLKVNR